VALVEAEFRELRWTPVALRGEVGGSSPFSLAGKGITDYRRHVKAATAILVKG
jgi:hypothetical protein